MYNIYYQDNEQIENVMELRNLAIKNNFENIHNFLRYDTLINEVDKTDYSEVSDQRAYVTIERSAYLYDTYLDENNIERNIKYRLSCDLDVWLDQVVRIDDGQIISAELDVELFNNCFYENPPRLYIDGSDIENYEIEEVELFKKFLFKESDIDLIKSIITDIYIRKQNAKYHYVLTAIMKDNGDVFFDYYNMYSDAPLSNHDDYHDVLKSLALNSPYGSCHNSTSFTGIDVDFDRGYSLIDIDITHIDEFNHDSPVEIYELHFFKG